MTALEHRTGPGPLMTSACLVIVVAGLQAAADVLVQILLALFIAIVSFPAMRALRRIGMPTALAVLGVVALVLVLLFGLVWVVAGSVAEFSASSEAYAARLERIVQDAAATLEGLGIEVGDRPVHEVVDSRAALRFAASVAGSVSTTLSGVLVVVFIVVFMLLEAGGIPDKLRRALGDSGNDLAGFRAVYEQIQGYLAAKTAISLLTGVLVWLLCTALGVDSALLWGLLAFLLNFIPNVGSILAAVPAVLLALVQHGAEMAGGLAIGYVAINMVVGNVLEPRILGRQLGLSPLVVLLSLIFWSWLWGPVGMLLSVPLTTVIKIGLESREDLRTIAILLGPTEEVPTGKRA